ncbi:MAG: hypothetical protein ABSD92_11195 [Candidatus Bathyarchaeia archaeon]
MTKNIHEEALKSISIDDAKIEVCPKIIDNTLVIGSTRTVRKAKTKMSIGMVKNKVPVKRTSRLEKATQHLYDLEAIHEPEKPLNIDLGLYQMENY